MIKGAKGVIHEGYYGRSEGDSPLWGWYKLSHLATTKNSKPHALPRTSPSSQIIEINSSALLQKRTDILLVFCCSRKSRMRALYYFYYTVRNNHYNARIFS